MENEEQFVDAITMIADKLGIAATHIYQVFVDAQMMRGTLLIVSTIAVVGLVIVGYFLTMRMFGGWTYGKVKAIKKENDEYFDSDDEAVLLFVPIVGAILFGLIGGMVVSAMAEGFMMMTCPEYTAISEIIDLVVP